MTQVIVVDDEEGIRTLLGRWLTSWGYEVRPAASANDALELMAINPAPIVLSDVMMPIHDGVWLVEQIHNRWPETAIVMATGAQDMELVVRMRRFGAVDYVSKPFGKETVRQALERAAAAIARPPAVD